MLDKEKLNEGHKTAHIRGFFGIVLSKRVFCGIHPGICGRVKIKESSVYYYFKNKQAIFDQLLYLFEKKAGDMMGQLDTALAEQTFYAKENFYQTVCDTFFDKYLMDNFCNRVMRMLL